MINELVEVRYYLEEELFNVEVLTPEKAIFVANEDERMVFPDSSYVVFSTFKDNIPLFPVYDEEEGEVVDLLPDHRKVF